MVAIVFDVRDDHVWRWPVAMVSVNGSPKWTLQSAWSVAVSGDPALACLHWSDVKIVYVFQGLKTGANTKIKHMATRCVAPVMILVLLSQRIGPLMPDRDLDRIKRLHG